MRRRDDEKTVKRYFARIEKKKEWPSLGLRIYQYRRARATRKKVERHGRAPKKPTLPGKQNFFLDLHRFIEPKARNLGEIKLRNDGRVQRRGRDVN